MRKPIKEIEYFDFPSGSFTHREMKYLGRKRTKWPWLVPLIGLVGALTIFHYALLPAVLRCV